jgi:hypothetical protein
VAVPWGLLNVTIRMSLSPEAYLMKYTKRSENIIRELKWYRTVRNYKSYKLCVLYDALSFRDPMPSSSKKELSDGRNI